MSLQSWEKGNGAGWRTSGGEPRGGPVGGIGWTVRGGELMGAPRGPGNAAPFILFACTRDVIWAATLGRASDGSQARPPRSAPGGIRVGPA
jgi:hypothetical protein